MIHYELNHVALHVVDVQKSIKFYTTILKLELIDRPDFDFPGAWFRLGEFQELHLIGGRNDSVDSRPRSNHFALRADDLDEWEEHFKKIDQKYEPRRTRPDGALQIYLADPDGYYIELFTGP
jgi:lactoylglutathione lyase